MKNLKIAALSFLFLFLSCSESDNNDIVTAEQSSATRIYLNAVKEATSALNQGQNNPIDLCFTLVFPVDVIYKNGNVTTLNSIDGLKQAIYSENYNFHITTILYPFNVFDVSTNNGLTVHTEQQFLDLLLSCNVKAIKDMFTSPNCFEFVFPVSIVKNDGSMQTISSLANLNDILNAMPPDEFWVDFAYPFQIIYGNDTITIENIWEFFNYYDCTPQNSCICTTVFNPVCVLTANGLVQFENEGWALCAGYTSDDFVPCN